jgi:hypothetical protein
MACPLSPHGAVCESAIGELLLAGRGSPSDDRESELGHPWPGELV